ncbi:MAG: (Fe-S) protein, partial [Dechloromonas sp.]|nr:(Fe-S) protein [Dechloromonas sp.]
MASDLGQAGVGKLGLCSGCSHYPDFLRAGRCTPGDACIRAHSGRQIDRFLGQNRDEAEKYLADIFWERRAIAARYAPIDTIYRV